MWAERRRDEVRGESGACLIEPLALITLACIDKRHRMQGQCGYYGNPIRATTSITANPTTGDPPREKVTS